MKKIFTDVQIVGASSSKTGLVLPNATTSPTTKDIDGVLAVKN